MITTTIADTAPYPARTGGVWRLVASTVTLPASITAQGNDFCYCGFDCDYEELALADASDTASYKNDRSAFIFRKVSASDTIAFTLEKAGTEVATLNDNTLGTYCASFPAQPLYTGFTLAWRQVLAGFGAGVYRFKATQTILGTVYEYESRIFRLLPYSDSLADGTVRVEAYQNGNVTGADFDFTGLNWFTSYRIPGIFGEKTPILEADNYVTQDFERVQIADRMRIEYKLHTKRLPAEIANALAYDQMLANSIFITDYNVLNQEIFRMIQVRPTSFADTPFESQNRRYRFSITLEPAKPDAFRKRNY